MLMRDDGLTADEREEYLYQERLQTFLAAHPLASWIYLDPTVVDEFVCLAMRHIGPVMECYATEELWKAFQPVISGYFTGKVFWESLQQAIGAGDILFDRGDLSMKVVPAPQLRYAERFAILKRDEYRCRICGATARTAKLEVDHITPRSKGGTNDPSNLWTLCFDCNRGKGTQEL